MIGRYFLASRQFEVITRCTIFPQIANFCRKVLGKEDGEQSAESPFRPVSPDNVVP